MVPDNNDITTIFRKSWSLYDFITERNYMFHQEIYAEVGKLLKARAAAGDYRMLDLGCGNARFLAACLEASPPTAYVGVDLSEAALNEARTWLAAFPQALLHQGDLLEVVATHSAQHEVIFSGFAIHHLDHEAKKRFFQAAASRLTPGGWLLLVDIVRDSAQDRMEYLQSYIAFMQDRWTELPAEQFDEARAHIEAFDYPETLVDLDAMAREAGFQTMRLVSQHGHHHTLLFTVA